MPCKTLKIVRIETIPIRVPLRQIYRGSHYQMSHRATILTRVHTEEGILGEAFVADEDHINDQIERVIVDEITPNLLGQDAFAVERCWELARPATWNILRDRRIGLVSCAAVDTAIWDAIGKALGQPLWKLWGGYRNWVEVIWTGGYYNTDISIEAEMASAREAQIAGMKFKVGGRSPEIDAKRFIEARKAAGDSFVLIADANQGYTPDEAVKFARMVEDYDLFYFEEPCRWQNDRRAMCDVRYRSGARVCAGQGELSAAGCRDLMVASAIDFCNFDGSWSGGPSEWRRVAAMALTFDVRMCHHEEAHIGAHLLASIPHGTFADTMHEDRDPIWSHMIANRPAVENGRITLSDRPGLGWELDEEFIEKYRIRYER
ncbi:MAG: mandelate racemase/muconate lactonizing enzyme family protein [Candidatus Acidiferrales bacterium]